MRRESPGGSPLRVPAGPVEGKTYSLYGPWATSDPYFEGVAEVVDAALRRSGDGVALRETITRAGRSRRSARRALAQAGSEPSGILDQATRRLGAHFAGARPHCATLPLADRCSATLAMSFEQYLVAAVEIELRNRLDADAFRSSGGRIAFLPHCLRDLEADCAARPQGLDTVCMACSDACHVNAVSRLLRRHGVQPYIWMSADLGRVLREQGAAPGKLGVLGIACVPELVAGMRRCARAGVPALGLPLDANRCARWFGEFRPTTVNLSRLEALVAGPRDRSEPCTTD